MKTLAVGVTNCSGILLKQNLTQHVNKTWTLNSYRHLTHALNKTQHKSHTWWLSSDNYTAATLTTPTLTLMNNNKTSNEMIKPNYYQIRTMRRVAGKRIRASYYVQSTGEVFEKSDLLSSIFNIILHPTKWISSIKYYYRTIASNSVIKSKLKALDKTQFSKKIFLNESKEIFIELNEALAKNDQETIKELTSIYFYSILAKKTGLDNRPKDVKTTWNATLNQPVMLWSRAGQIKTSHSGGHEFFGQICVSFSGKQSVTNYDKKGQIISSIDNVDFQDNYVFERCLSSLPSNWRICAQIEPGKEIQVR
ncbi:hypothetical protein DLAC_05426 [Tieghemostelium lacteum]|uniref:Large ribosomal subunit protein mL45 n=1 Tax=Tieghemostelium lacteum TaxID=361077 RepID=A0A151ZFT6_TIELA|nr:hypothetical protein DLAC_05426 [Tieghemostelium lacteum]|eukprot:KYQ92842.1 hypothetical protein DLAC_05426 [Tieghemostelium lacteum]